MSVDAGSVYMDVGFNVPKIAKDLERSVKQAADKAAPAAAKSFEQKLAGFGATASKIGRQFTLGLSLPVAAGMVLVTKGAAELEQAVGGTAAVFKSQAGAIESFAKGAADSVGLSEKAARTFTTQIGAALKGYGFSAAEAADKSIELTKLGADLAATFGGTTADAVTALGAALRGEFDPLERFGATLTADMVAAKAVSMGLAKTKNDVDQHAKAQAALTLIMEKSADAHGQYARELDTAAGAAQTAAAKAENAADDLGKAFLPIYTKVSQATSTVASGFQALPEAGQSAVAGIGTVAVIAGPTIFALGKMAQGIGVVRKSMDAGALSAGSYGRTLAGIGLAATAGAAIGLGIGNKIAGDADDAATQAFGQINFADIDAAAQKLDVVGRQIEADTQRWNEYNLAERAAHFQEGQNLESVKSQHAEYNRMLTQQKLLQGELAQRLGVSGEEAKRLVRELKIDPATIPMDKLVDVIGQYKSGAITAADATAKLGGETAKTGAIADATTEKVASMAEQLASVGDSFFGFMSAQKSYRDAVKGIGDAQRAAADATRAVGDAQRAQQDAFRAVGDAQRAYGDSLRGIDDAHRAYEDAVLAVADAEERRVDSLRKVQDAQQDVTDAQAKLNEALAGPSEDDQISLERARIRLSQARRTLNEGGFDSSTDKRSAQLDVRDAEREIERLEAELSGRVGQAQQDLIDAQQDLTASQRDAADAARGVGDAQQAAADSALAIGDAQRAATDAARGVSDAQRAAADSALAVSDAQRAATEATDNITTATQNAADAAIQLNEKQHEAFLEFQNSSAALDPMIEQLETVKRLYPEIAGAIDPYIQKLREMQGLVGDKQRAEEMARQLGMFPESYPDIIAALNSKAAMISGAAPGTRFTLDQLAQILGVTGRADGGPVFPHNLYEVNERGVPELFQSAGRQFLLPTEPGKVIPMDRGRGSRSAVVHQSINLPETNPRTLAKEIDYYQGRALATGGAER